MTGVYIVVDRDEGTVRGVYDSLRHAATAIQRSEHQHVDVEFWEGDSYSESWSIKDGHLVENDLR